MAQYKVPQDVEAEDKLLGPFTFRQFIYLLIGAGCIAMAWGLAQIFIFLAIIPIPFAIFFIVLALPLKKDQPMETYLAAVLSFYLKPNKRVWTPGQRESTIKITVPKKVEKSRVRDITEAEATSRLSFLANLVDTEGYSIRGGAKANEFAGSSIRDEYLAEADQVMDVMNNDNPVIDNIIAAEQTARRTELYSQMQTAINNIEIVNNTPTPNPSDFPIPNQTLPNTPPTFQQAYPQTYPQQPTPTQQMQMQALANNNNFSVQTIAQQANRINQTQAQMFGNPTAPGQAQAQSAPATPTQAPTPPIDLYGGPTAIFSN